MRILVTGASGFIGGALTSELRRRGHDVLGLGRRKLSSGSYVSWDLSAGAPPVTHSPDAVIHCAARSAPWGTEREFESQNVKATENVIRFCEQHHRPYLLHVSTSAVMYKNEHQLGMTEETALPCTPINRYAASKLRAEQLVQGYSGSHCIVRPRAVFGPGDTVVFPRILRAARAGRLPRIESDQPVLGDLIYIDTLVEYLCRILERRSTGLYILTNNAPVPILEFLDQVLRALNFNSPQKRVRVGTAMRLAGIIEGVYSCLPVLGEPPVTRFGVSVFAYSKTFTIAKAVRDLGDPSVSLDEGVTRFVAWQSRQPA